MMTRVLHRLLLYIKPLSPRGTLRGHLWFALDRFLQTWTTRGLWAALHSVWAKRIRPLYTKYAEVPDNLFYARQIRTHGHKIKPHNASVDIIVCVHNALPDAQVCLSSVIRHTRAPYRLMVVDDGSAEETRQHLDRWCTDQGATLIRHESACGYTRAANAGLKASSATYVVLLNSDTIVTPLWLDRLVACAESHARVGLVGPLSNAASWQSVPQIIDEDGDWHENPLPDGFSHDTWAQAIGQASEGLYPSMPFLNGFCLLIKKAVLDEVGLFDEINFARGYGEENDYALRARKAGWALVLADDAYVWHTQSRSYSHTRRKQLAASAQDTLNRLHGADVFTSGCGTMMRDLVLQGIRTRVDHLPGRLQTIRDGMERHEGRRLLFLLPTAQPGGGSHVIIQEAKAMQRMGVDVRLFNLAANKKAFHLAYPENTVPVLYGQSLEDLYRVLPDFDAVIATLFSTVDWIQPAKAGAEQVKRAYYIQDYEPWFFAEGTPDHDQAFASYTAIPDLQCLTKTEWNRQTVLEQTGRDAIVLGPSVDIDLFRPRPQAAPSQKMHILAMIRPETERRNPAMTLRVLENLALRHPENVRVTLFGCDDRAPMVKAARKRFKFHNAGVITRTQLASLLPSVDCFVDYSSYQAMGLTTLEAMAAGAAVILPERGGGRAFARHAKNAIMVDTRSESNCYEALETLLGEPAVLETIRQQGLIDACSFSPEHAALKALDALFPLEGVTPHA